MFEIIIIQFKQINATCIILNAKGVFVVKKIIKLAGKIAYKISHENTSFEMPVMGSTHSRSFFSSVVM